MKKMWTKSLIIYLGFTGLFTLSVLKLIPLLEQNGIKQPMPYFIAAGFVLFLLLLLTIIIFLSSKNKNARANVCPGVSEKNNTSIHATFWLARSIPVFVNNRLLTSGAVISAAGRAASSFMVFSLATLSAERLRFSRFCFRLKYIARAAEIAVDPKPPTAAGSDQSILVPALTSLVPV